MKRRRKPAVFTIQPGSPRLVMRLAALLAYQALPWSEQNKFDERAKELLRLMHTARP